MRTPASIPALLHMTINLIVVAMFAITRR